MREGVPWPRIFAEGLAVLLSILAAFAIDAAWERHRDREAEANYLNALRTELESNREEITPHLTALALQVDSTFWDLENIVLRDPATVTEDEISLLLAHQGPSVLSLPRRVAFDDLVSSGGLQILRSDGLRRAITAYGQQLESDMAAQEALSEFWEERLSPYQQTYGALGGVIDPYNGRVPTRMGFASDVNAFVQNRDYANRLLGRIDRARKVVTQRELLLARIEELIELVNEQL